MKVGSLIVCIDNSLYNRILCIIPQLEPVIYTVRAIGPCSCGCGKIAILLEEITTMVNGREMSYLMEDFREVLPPNPAHMEEINQLEELV